MDRIVNNWPRRGEHAGLLFRHGTGKRRKKKGKELDLQVNGGRTV